MSLITAAVAAVVAAVAAVVVVEVEEVVVLIFVVVRYEQFLERTPKDSVSLMGEVLKERPKASVKMVVVAEGFGEGEVWG